MEKNHGGFETEKHQSGNSCRTRMSLDRMETWKAFRFSEYFNPCLEYQSNRAQECRGWRYPDGVNRPGGHNTRRGQRRQSEFPAINPMDSP